MPVPPYAHVLVTVCPVSASCRDQSFHRTVLIVDAAAHRERLAALGKAWFVDTPWGHVAQH